MITTLLHGYLPANPNKEEFDELLAVLGFQLTISELRAPGWTSPELPRLQEWHQDGIAFEQLVMWASVYPSFYRIKSSKRVVIVGGGDIVLVNNQLVEHRMPIETTGRWFYRGIVNSRGQTAANKGD